MGRLHPASVSRKACGQGNAIHLQPPPNKTAALQSFAARLRLSKKWLAPLFRGFHSSLAPTARPGSYARKPLLRKAFCGFDAHPPGGLLLSLRDNSPCVAKSDYSLRGQSRAPPVAGGARRKPSEQGSARKAPRADAARPLRTALRPPNPQGFFDRLPCPKAFAFGHVFIVFPNMYDIIFLSIYRTCINPSRYCQ